MENHRQLRNLVALGLLVLGTVSCTTTPYLDEKAVHVGLPDDAVKESKLEEAGLHSDDWRKQVVMIYNHGTTKPQISENCNASWNRIPDTLSAVQDKRILIHPLCSKAKESYSEEQVGRYVYLRLMEVEHLVDEFLARGVRAENIILAGHSAGGWVSLMAARYFGEKFNAVIAFAPAFAGKRSERYTYPAWRGIARPMQVKEMLEAEQINALIFAYHGDAYNQPEDLEFLTDRYPQTVRMVAYTCEVWNRHLIHVNDCRASETRRHIDRFIRQNVSF